MAINRSVIVTLGFSVIAAGCSGGGGTTSAPSTPVPTVAPTATPTASPTTSPTATPTATPSPKPTAIATPTASPVPTGPVTSVVTTSTNVQGYTIVLQQSGSATITQDSYTGTTTVPAADAAQFFKDLNAYSPIAQVVTLNTCVKSSSYGTYTKLTYNDSTTGDVSCAPAPTAPAAYLYADEQKIETDMKKNLGPFTH